MSFLTEHDIKHAALRFLKTHYKHRNRLGETTAQVDMVTSSGVIADGHISYKTGLEHDFLATFEATSYAKADEVKYKVRKSQLNWDSLTFGFIVGMLFFLFIYIQNYFVIRHEGVPLFAILLIGGILFFSLLYRLVFSRISNYRQIYALEQFKLYDADDQWVAVGIDVFENPEDKYLKELKRQCINHGFGLIVVEKDFDIRQSISPAKKNVTGKKRKRQEFVAAENVPEKNMGFSDRVFNLMGWEKEKRFRYDFRIQLLLIFLCSSILFALLWKEWNKRDIVEVNTKKYRQKILEDFKDWDKETGFYLIDSGYVVSYDSTIQEYDLGEIQYYDQIELKRWYTEKHQDSLWAWLEDRDYPDHQKVLDSINVLLENDKNKTIKSSPKKIAGVKKKKKKGMDTVCKTYADWYGKRYILRDGVYKTLKNAEYRISQINKASVLGGIVRGGCFKETPAYYIVYVDVPYKDLSKAESSLPYFNQLLKDKGYSSGELELQLITVKR